MEEFGRGIVRFLNPEGKYFTILRLPNLLANKSFKWYGIGNIPVTDASLMAKI